MRVLELYSGVGGMHFALKGSSIADRADVVAAVELNPVCNRVYAHNFPDTKILNKNICSMTATDINRLSPDIILMSPPCQPFTRLGKQKDVNDSRNESFLHFINLLPQLTSVSHLLMENVDGFQSSETRKRLLMKLETCNFTCEEYSINPRQFGICNSRLRYYLLAKKVCHPVINVNCISSDLPEDYEKTLETITRRQAPNCLTSVLEYQPTSPEWRACIIPNRVTRKYITVMDVVSCHGISSCCFTRGYTRYLEGTGSLLSSLNVTDLECCMNELKNSSTQIDENEFDERVQKLELRFFTPKEVARLMSFPESFSFPPDILDKQRYKTICNSINVFVVSFLLSHLMKNT